MTPSAQCCVFSPVSETIPSTRTPCIEFLQQVVLSASRAELTPAISAAEARRRQKHKGKHLNAVAVGQLLIVAARVVRVEEVIVVVLVVLPLREEQANDDRNGEEDAEERGVVDAKRLAGALTTRLVACETRRVQGAGESPEESRAIMIGRDGPSCVGAIVRLRRACCAAYPRGGRSRGHR